MRNNTLYICRSCRRSLLPHPSLHNVSSLKSLHTRPSFAPKPLLDLKHIRNNPGLYEQNCLDRNYAPYARNGWRILELHDRLVEQQRQVLKLRQRSNAIGKQLGLEARRTEAGEESKGALLEEAKALKQQLAGFETSEKQARDEMERLALQLPNLSSLLTPVGEQPVVLGVINEELLGSDKSRGHAKGHVEIGRELDIIDFEAGAATSGWGWYFLKNEGALLEQALIQYALSVAMKRGWKVMTPPSLVYSHVATACGFMPRDQHGETQIYDIAQHEQEQEQSSAKPSLVLAGTAEIPFAGSQAKRVFTEDELPLKVIGPSRCYRAEAGARGVDTKGLYRVHEFTKVEMFAWTLPSTDGEGERFGGEEDEDATSQADDVFTEMLDIQREIFTSLNLPAKILEMPTTDLGASATRKIDIEAFFPSRTAINAGYGEITSASMCTDYQTRRLATRLKLSGKLAWPYTLNGTAMAIPRVLACILENHWNPAAGVVHVPTVLQQYMLGHPESIHRKAAKAH